jgi:tellurite resistance protein TerC
MFSNEVLFFGGFILVISVMLLLDLGVFNKKDHVVKFGELHPGLLRGLYSHWYFM